MSKLKKILKTLFVKKKQVVRDEKKYVASRNTIISGVNNIGDYTYIGFNSNITKSIIGRYCSIANNVSIGIGEHKIQRVSTSSLFYSEPFATLTEKECIIGNDVWIGSNVVVRRGVKVGDGAIIGANSFVNKDVEPYEIVGGLPAKHIRYRFDKRTIDILLKSKWWELDIEDAKAKIKELNKLNIFELDDCN